MLVQLSGSLSFVPHIFGVNVMLRPAPKLLLYSCGWADVADHVEALGHGLVFYIGDVGHDPEEEHGGGTRAAVGQPKRAAVGYIWRRRWVFGRRAGTQHRLECSLGDPKSLFVLAS